MREILPEQQPQRESRPPVWTTRLFYGLPRVQLWRFLTLAHGLCLGYEGSLAFLAPFVEKTDCEADEPLHTATFRWMPLPTLHIEMYTFAVVEVHTFAVAAVRKVRMVDKECTGSSCTAGSVLHFSPAMGERCTDSDSPGTDKDLVAQKEAVEVEALTAAVSTAEAVKDGPCHLSNQLCPPCR